MKNIKEKQDYNLNDKILTLIIKNLPNNINKIFINKSKNKIQIGNISQEPNINIVQNTGLFYYDNFELIDKEIYSLLFKKDKREIYGECYFINNYICIKMPKELNNNSLSVVYIFGSLNQNNIFKAKYLLEYNSDKNFKKNFEYANNNGSFDKYLNSFKFDNNNIEKLTDIDKNNIGLIYNIYIDNNMNSINQFIKPPLIGLKSIQSFPYSNAILQCFCHIEQFVNYFKYNNYVEQKINYYNRINKQCLTESFKNLIENLWPSNKNNKVYNPDEINNKLITLNPLFKSYDTVEIKDLINFIIMTLHEELNKKNRNQNNFNNNNINLDQSNQNLMFSLFAQQFANDNQSIISDLFYWSNQTTIHCMQCGIEKYNYQTSSVLIFPLEEINKYKNNQNIISIYDCFSYYQKEEILSGENALPCNNCRLISNNKYISNIYTSPEIFILIIHKPKFSPIKFEFYEEMNLSKFIITNNLGSIYKLIGVVIELNRLNRRFIGYCRNPINYCWYKYDDENINVMNNFKNEIIHSANPCVLFYQKSV